MSGDHKYQSWEILQMPTSASIAKPIEVVPSQSGAGVAFDLLHDRIQSTLNKPLFFIVGCQKSGTTWLQRLLNAHPEIACEGESNLGHSLMQVSKQIPKIFNAGTKQYDPQYNVTEADALYLFQTMVGLIFAKWGGDDSIRCVGEKSPDHSQYAAALANVLPGARFIHIVRDPRDVTTSGWHHHVRTKTKIAADPVNGLRNYVELMASTYWNTYVTGARQVSAIDSARYLEIRYEDLNQSPVETTQKLLQFLLVDDSESAIEQCLSGASFKKLSGGRASGVEDQSSFYRKGIVGDWRNLLDDSMAKRFRECVGDLMDELGYTD